MPNTKPKLLRPIASVKWKGITLPTYEEVCGHSEYPLRGEKTYNRVVREYMRDKWPMTIYRCIAVDDPTEIDTAQVGTSWTYNVESAEPYYGLYGPGRGIYVLIAQVNPQQVDWIETIAMNMMPNDDECEIAVKRGEQLEITGIMEYKESRMGENYEDEDIKPFHVKMVTV